MTFLTRTELILSPLSPACWSKLVRKEGRNHNCEQKLRVGVVWSGGQAPGGHNVIAGIFDYLQEHAPESVFYGFKVGPAGIMRNKVVEITADFLLSYRNQGGFDIISREETRLILLSSSACRAHREGAGVRRVGRHWRG